MEQTEIDGRVLSKCALKPGTIAFKFGHFRPWPFHDIYSHFLSQMKHMTTCLNVDRCI